MPVGHDEPVTADPLGVGGVVSHHPLIEQIGQRGQAHGSARMAVADLLHRIGCQQPGRVDSFRVEVGPPVGMRRRDAVLGVGHRASSRIGSRIQGRFRPVVVGCPTQRPSVATSPVPQRAEWCRLIRAHGEPCCIPVVPDSYPDPVTQSPVVPVEAAPSYQAVDEGTIAPVLRLRAVSPRTRSRVASFVALTKPRIIELLLVTTLPSMVLAAGGLPEWWTVVATMV